MSMWGMSLLRLLLLLLLVVVVVMLPGEVWMEEGSSWVRRTKNNNTCIRAAVQLASQRHVLSSAVVCNPGRETKKRT